MPIVTNQTPVIVPMSTGSLTWDEFTRGLGVICGRIESLMQAPRSESSRARTGWVCKVSPDHIGDIMAWPQERQLWTRQNLNISAGSEVDLIDIPGIRLTLALDRVVPKGTMHWSFHWAGIITG